ncbi:sugar transferase [Pelagibacterium lacus]|uniref:Sugar transferase n=1 Tax=Pelagibacterium lacus TaxID=2282655 RepID=A0A369W4B0_9HYPH|nr:sugar transferase [Pelagibacterium lacus]
MLVPALVSAVLQCVVYTLFILRAHRSDWNNLALACLVLAIMPFVVSAIIAALRSQEFPFTLSAVITLVVHNFGVVVLSAMRVPISYSALLAAAPIAVGMMIIGATRLTRNSHERLAVLDFPGAQRASKLIGGDITILSAAGADLADFDRILIDGATHHTPAWSEHLTRAQMRGTLVTPWFAVLEQKWGRVIPDYFDVSHLAYRAGQIYYTRLKRFLDVLLVVLALPVVLPLGALIWLYIRALDGGPSLFVQTRRGYGGRNFRMLKFRTMRKGSQGGATGTGDDRILPGCALLRRLRLDELPQLVNILRGEMSWIGPRPVSLEIARACEQLTPAYKARYLVLPGITGWAQVQYPYAGTAREELEKLEYDLYYLKRISLDLDLEIMFRTIRTLVTGKGAR